MRRSSGGAPNRAVSRADAHRTLEPRARANPDGNDRALPRGLALEGGGDLRAAFLKNRRTHDNQQPQGGEEDEGGQWCNHRIDPSWERLTEPDPICSSWRWTRSGEAGDCSLFVLACQEALIQPGQQLESVEKFG